MADQKDGRSQNQPSHDAQVKGGEHSHGGTNSEKTQPDQKQGKQQPPNQEETSKGGRHSQGENDTK
jgi:hypothetical protein